MSNLARLPVENQQPSQIIKTVDDLSRIAKMMAASGYFSDAKDAAQAGVKIMAGLEMGVPAFAALTGIHVIKGKPALGANLMAAKVKGSGKYNYRVLDHSDQACRIEFLEIISGKLESIGISEFTRADAQRCGTQNMDKFAKNMLFARAISNGVRWYCPDLFLGAPVYTPEELGAVTDNDGNVIEAQAVEVVHETENNNRAELIAIASRLNLGGASITEALKQVGKDKPSDLTPEELYKAQLHLMFMWGQAQGVFKHANHAWNSLNKLLEENPGATTVEVVDLWISKVGSKSAQEVF